MSEIISNQSGDEPSKRVGYAHLHQFFVNTKSILIPSGSVLV